MTDVINTATTGFEVWLEESRGDRDDLVLPRPSSWWTGKMPKDCPGVLVDGTVTALPAPDLSKCSRQDLLDYFDNSWTLSEVLFSSLQGEEAFYRPPYHSLRHPLIFYYCHPAALFVNKFLIAGLLDEPVNPYFENIFETGVDEMTWDDLSKNVMTWPTIQEVTDYRRTVYKVVRNIIETHSSMNNLPINIDHPLWAVMMSIEHEKIHLETSSVLIRELPVRLVQRPEEWPKYHPSALRAEGNFPENELVKFGASTVAVGKNRDFPSYGWDNEYGLREMDVPEFEVAKFMCSNGEFLEFVKDGGYSNQSLWSDEGWKWRCFRNTKWPTFWVPDGPQGYHSYQLRLTFDVVPMNLSLPAIVNVHEAVAFCNWKSQKEALSSDSKYRLITESEHLCIRPPSFKDERMRQVFDPIMTASGEVMKSKFNYNLNCAWGSESPVDALPVNDSSTKCYDVMGNVWEWSLDLISALPGFKCDKLYEDFTTPCMDGQHHIILGGSFVSCGNEASVFARYHFRPHFYQHAGFRYVKGTKSAPLTHIDSPPPHVGGWHPSSQSQSGGVYESQEYLGQYMLLHFANSKDVMEEGISDQNIFGEEFLSRSLNFPQRCAQKLVSTAKALNIPCVRALDVGCAVGGAVFEFAKEKFQYALGVDISASFINTANEMKEKGKMSFYRKDEGDIGTELTAMVNCPASLLTNTEFRQMDACALAPDLGEFDCVLLANLLCRLPSPSSCLGRMGGIKGLVKKGGLLLVTTPFTWMPQFSPRETWLGGYRDDDNQAIESSNGLKNALSNDFDLLEEFSMPLIIREHRRKFQLITPLATLWRRKN